MVSGIAKWLWKDKEQRGNLYYYEQKKKQSDISCFTDDAVDYRKH